MKTRFRVLGSMGGSWIAAVMKSDHAHLDDALAEARAVAIGTSSATVYEFVLTDPERRRVVATMDATGHATIAPHEPFSRL
jgi:hypothetical protein